MDITPTPEDAICHLIEALKAAGPHIERYAALARNLDAADAGGSA
jgi:hypothetical protein